jgi:hypothetical protein
MGPGRFQLTQRGRGVLAEGVPFVDIAFLESRFPEMAEFRRTKSRSGAEEPAATYNAANGVWSMRDGVEERIRATLEEHIPDAALRDAALRFLAFVIENADEERGDAWFVRETENGIRVMGGRLLAARIRRQKIHVSVIGPIDEQIRNTLAIDADEDEEFKFKNVPGALLISFPVEHAEAALPLLKNPLSDFVDAAMARVRNAERRT